MSLHKTKCMIVDDEPFWGREQFPMVRLRLKEMGLGRAGDDGTHGVFGRLILRW